MAGFWFSGPIVSLPGMGLNGEKPNRRTAMGCLTIAGSLRRLAVMLAPLLAAGGAYAQDAFPSKPVHLLVPFPAGGAVDIVARTLGDELARRWGQSVIIENRPGAGGTIAAAAAAKAPPDGYTLVLVASGHAIVAHLYPKLSYDPLRDFTPLSLVGSSPNMLLVRADSALTTVADVLALARATPGRLSYGHAGNGTSPHLAGELLKYMTRIDITAVPYKGGAASLNDLLGGHIPLSFNNIPESIAQVRAGAVRALGVTTAVLPGDIKARLAADCAAAVQVPAVRERLLALGAAPIGSAPEAFENLIRSDYEKWGPVIKAAEIKGE